MPDIEHTPEEWVQLKHPNLRIYDPDGWRGPTGRPFTDPIGEDEFDWRFGRSTVVSRPMEET